MRQNQEDPQWGREICRCSRCGGELYCGQTYYEVEGHRLCEDCLAQFAAELLRPYLRIAGEMEVVQ